MKTIIFLTAAYLKFASSSMWEKMQKQTRMILLIAEGEKHDDTFLSHFDLIHHVPATLTQNVHPVMKQSDILKIIQKELNHLGNDPNKLRLFCQEECHILQAAQIRDKLNIPGHNTSIIENFRNKLKMKKQVAAAGITTPQHLSLDLQLIQASPAEYYEALTKQLGKRIVIKPIDSAGSFQVIIIDTLAQFLSAIKQINSSDYQFQYEVDAFIEGTMYQCDSFIRNGEVIFCGALELGCTNFDFVQGQPLSVFPVPTSSLRSRLEAFNKKIIQALNFQDGSTHLELFFDKKQDKFIFLEIAARVPGGIGVPYHEKNSHINLIDANLALTLALDPTPKSTASNNVVAALLPVGFGEITALNKPPIRSKYKIDWHVKIGQHVESHSLVNTAGILMLWNNNQKQLRQDFEALKDYKPTDCS